MKTNDPNVLIKHIKNLTDKKVKQVQNATKINAQELAKIAKRNAVANTGRLRGDIIVAPGSTDKHNITYHVVATAPYSAYIEFGTGTKVSIPPEFKDMAAEFQQEKSGTFEQGLRAIKDWCRAKGIPEEAAYPIFLRILKVGIEAQPFIYPAFQVIKKQYLQDLKDIVDE